MQGADPRDAGQGCSGHQTPLAGVALGRHWVARDDAGRCSMGNSLLELGEKRDRMVLLQLSSAPKCVLQRSMQQTLWLVSITSLRLLVSTGGV